MQYIKVAWKHAHPDEPVLLYSELDDARWEIRKVEVFRDGLLGYASRKDPLRGSTGLSVEQVPALSKIASIPEFEPAEITRAEFEEIWRQATGGSSDSE
jgi:hypothetical protein